MRHPTTAARTGLAWLGLLAILATTAGCPYQSENQRAGRGLDHSQNRRETVDPEISADKPGQPGDRTVKP